MGIMDQLEAGLDEVRTIHGLGIDDNPWDNRTGSQPLTVADMARMSQAISLKRIADALEDIAGRRPVPTA